MAWELWTTDRDKEVLVDNGEPGLLGRAERSGAEVCVCMCVCLCNSFLHRTTCSGVLRQFNHYNCLYQRVMWT